MLICTRTYAHSAETCARKSSKLAFYGMWGTWWASYEVGDRGPYRERWTGTRKFVCPELHTASRCSVWRRIWKLVHSSSVDCFQQRAVGQSNRERVTRTSRATMTALRPGRSRGAGTPGRSRGSAARDKEVQMLFGSGSGDDCARFLNGGAAAELNPGQFGDDALNVFQPSAFRRTRPLRHT
jgi:hypothetical protein